MSFEISGFVIDNAFSLLLELVDIFLYNHHSDRPSARIEQGNSNEKIVGRMMMKIATSTFQHSQPNQHQGAVHRIVSSLLPMISIDHHLIGLHNVIVMKLEI